ncbi:ras-related protein Rab-34a isoform X1 [Syngnathus typhle]|uniref:ras-related protein Rab-34a isoform X1 n=1 Tax=Syngnathus typhle TaxID=161592 RepID=UPI002A6B3193|nr:ras-related protein Rab-34a isoform X1 [Syngnathus typhle]XP_061136323.1 ras-related protein Rab-34a isoform X1 [Syngnathus typhle]
MSTRGPSMSVLPPVRKDRIIPQFPQCFCEDAALQAGRDFNPKVKAACQQQRTGTVGYVGGQERRRERRPDASCLVLSRRFKIAKVIVVGDLAVGKTCLINRFCKDAFDKNYKATIGVDFEMERFEVLGVPFSLQLWDTAGQERFKCIASTYYRAAQVVIIVFDVTDVASLDHTRQWLEDALRENDPTAVQLFLVGTKKDLSSPAQYSQIERDALQVAGEMRAEYWALSSLTGENVKEFFFRVASLAFENNVLAELEKSGTRQIGNIVKIQSAGGQPSKKRKQPACCQ